MAKVVFKNQKNDVVTLNQPKLTFLKIFFGFALVFVGIILVILVNKLRNRRFYKKQEELLKEGYQIVSNT